METKIVEMHGQKVTVTICPPAAARRIGAAEQMRIKSQLVEPEVQTHGTPGDIERYVGEHYRPIEELFEEAREERCAQYPKRRRSHLERDREYKPPSWAEWCEMAGVETTLTADEYFYRKMPTPGRNWGKPLEHGQPLPRKRPRRRAWSKFTTHDAPGDAKAVEAPEPTPKQIHRQMIEPAMLAAQRQKRQRREQRDLWIEKYKAERRSRYLRG